MKPVGHLISLFCEPANPICNFFLMTKRLFTLCRGQKRSKAIHFSSKLQNGDEYNHGQRRTVCEGTPSSRAPIPVCLLPTRAVSPGRERAFLTVTPVMVFHFELLARFRSFSLFKNRSRRNAGRFCLPAGLRGTRLPKP